MRLKAVAAAAVLCIQPSFAAGGEESDAEKEKAAEQAARAKEWEERVRDEVESQARYWAEKAQEDAAARAKAMLEMAQLKEKAKGFTGNSTPQDVEKALGKVSAELITVRGKTRSKNWRYLHHVDDDSYLKFEVEFGGEGQKTCTVHAVEKFREQAANEPRHVLEGVFDSFYVGYPSDEAMGFACEDASIDGKAVGKVPFVVAYSPRVSGRVGHGAKVRIVYHGRADDLVFLGPGALRLESMNFTGLPDRATEPPPDEDGRPASERTEEVVFRFPPVAQKTMDLLKNEIVPAVDYEGADPAVVFADISRRLEGLGVTHRFVTRIPEPSPSRESTLGGAEPMEPRKVTLHLRNVPLFKLMSYFGDLSYWGWQLYPDGSISYTDMQCACGYPRDGRAGHIESFARGLKSSEE